MADSPLIQRIRTIVEPIASDLDLDIYDVEQRGGTMRVTLDTRPGSDASIDLEQLALATRLISRQLDHEDPVPGKYTLEVTSPGVERTLRTPAHFQRELGKTVNVRLANVDAEQRRLEGVLVSADERTATIRVGDADQAAEHTVELSSIDRARTVFVWGPQPKPGQPRKAAARKPATKSTSKSGKATTTNEATDSEASDAEAAHASSHQSVKEPS